MTAESIEGEWGDLIDCPRQDRDTGRGRTHPKV